DAALVEPAADIDLHVPLGIPLWQNDHRGARIASREEPGMNSIVFAPQRLHGARECQHPVAATGVLGWMQDVVVSWTRREPFFAVCGAFSYQRIKDPLRVPLFGEAADVFQPPGKRPHPAIIVGRPAAMFVSPKFLFEPGHGAVNEPPEAENWTENL